MKCSGEISIVQSAVIRKGRGTAQTSSDNRAELNWNDGRLNVNNNWDSNRNDNVWLSAAWYFFLSFIR